MKENYISVEGIVEEIIYVNEENGYTVMEFSTTDDGFTAVGILPFIYEGENLVLNGNFICHPEYGEQFKVESFEKCVPKTVTAISAFLSSGIIRGVRAATARKIVEKFGADSLEVIAEEPERLSEIKGISPTRAAEIGESYLEKKNVTDIIIFLQKYGISINLAMKINNVLGSFSVKKIEENPYVLCDSVDGISFTTADKIAENMGISSSDGRRIRSGIRYTLQRAALSGHTYLTAEMLTAHAAEILGAGETEIANALVNLSVDSNIYAEAGDEIRYFLPSLFAAETNIAAKLIAIRENKGRSLFYKTVYDFVYEACSIELAENQKKALRAVLENNVSIITGGPGTGKTTVIKSIIAVMEEKGLKVTLAAPTGRAAKRISEVCEREASTLHRLLEVTFGAGGRERFVKNSENPINTDVIIIDEMSMVDAELFSALLNAVRKKTRLVLVGDINQLPSVGAGNVLKDIINSEKFPCVYLDEIFRQAKKSMIVHNAHGILKGNFPETGGKESDFFIIRKGTSEAITREIEGLLSERLPNYLKTDNPMAIQVLAPMKKTLLGTFALNEMLQKKLNPPSRLKKEKQWGKYVFREGDRVIQTRNNYDILWEDGKGNDGSGIFNGDTGIIRSINKNENTVIIEFYDGKIASYDSGSLEDIDLAYAITVHKSQGCEFEAVVIPLLYGYRGLLNRNLLYTAVTRAKSLVVLVGSDECIDSMIKNEGENQRFTTLCERLDTFDVVL